MKQFLKPAFLLAMVAAMTVTGAWAQKSKIKDTAKFKVFSQTSVDGKYTWFSVGSDPLNTRQYTLKN